MEDQPEENNGSDLRGREARPAKKTRRRGANSKHKGSRKTSGSYRPYPRVPLEKAILVAMAIKDKNGGNPWPAGQVAAAVGLSPKNVNFYYLFTSLSEIRLNYRH